MITDAAASAAGARRVFRNTAAPFLGNLAARLMTWGLAMVMARTLGPAGTGAYAFAVNLWLYASIIADFGLGTWLTREVARAPASAREALRDTLGLRLALASLAMPFLVGAAAVFAAIWPAEQGGAGGPSGAGAGEGEGWKIVATAALLGLGLLPGAVSAAGTALFNAYEEMTFPAAVQLAGATLTAVAGAAALLAGFDYVALGWVSLLVNCLTAAVFAAACARRFFPLGASFRPAQQVALAREAFPLMINSLLNNVFFRIDVTLLQSKGSAVVGNYANAYKVIDAAGTVPSSFVLALFPVLSRRAAGGPDAPDGHAGLGRVYRLALKLLMAAALPLALLVSYGAADLTLAFWGPEFLPHSALALQILIWFLPLSFFNGLTQYVLIAAGLQRRITVAFALAATFNLLANLLLIPRYSYVAAAWVTIASEVALLVPFLLALRRRLAIGPAALAALRPLPAALLMALTLWGGGLWSRPLAALVAIAVYPVALLATGAFEPSERQALLGLAPAQLRRRLSRATS